jgi:PncC family amidohydrolase
VSDLIDRVAGRMIDRGLRLALAESCTGGLLAARLTERPGASRYLAAGVVAYSNEAKSRLLGVRPATLAAHGAVSEAVAVEMADGARGGMDVEAAVSITGVAGPGGGTDEKPVGTVWIGAAVETRRAAERFRFEGDRAAVREQSVAAALKMLDRLLEGGE